MSDFKREFNKQKSELLVRGAAVFHSDGQKHTNQDAAESLSASACCVLVYLPRLILRLYILAMSCTASVTECGLRNAILSTYICIYFTWGPQLTHSEPHVIVTCQCKNAGGTAFCTTRKPFLPEETWDVFSQKRATRLWLGLVTQCFQTDTVLGVSEPWCFLANQPSIFFLYFPFVFTT